jgi:hypothetical protein
MFSMYPELNASLYHIVVARIQLLCRFEYLVQKLEECGLSNPIRLQPSMPTSDDMPHITLAGAAHLYSANAARTRVNQVVNEVPMSVTLRCPER